MDNNPKVIENVDGLIMPSSVEGKKVSIVGATGLLWIHAFDRGEQYNKDLPRGQSAYVKRCTIVAARLKLNADGKKHHLRCYTADGRICLGDESINKVFQQDENAEVNVVLRGQTRAEHTTNLTTIADRLKSDEFKGELSKDVLRDKVKLERTLAREYEAFEGIATFVSSAALYDNIADTTKAKKALTPAQIKKAKADASKLAKENESKVAETEPKS